MPAGNRMGPSGSGPMTGRGLGQCSGNARSGNLNNFRRQGLGFRQGFGGRGRGGGRGMFGWGQSSFLASRYQSPTSKEEKEMMTENLKDLKAEVTAIENRIKELNKQKK